jgi:hypothetical protein
MLQLLIFILLQLVVDPFSLRDLSIRVDHLAKAMT